MAEILFTHSYFLRFDPKEFRDKDLNMYKEFTPEKVMVIFKEKFIDAL